MRGYEQRSKTTPVTSVDDLKQVRSATWLVAAIACLLGFFSCLVGLLGDHGQVASRLHPASVLLAWTSLVCIAAVLASMFCVWMPVHDRILKSLRAPYRAQRVRRLQLFEGYRSAPLRCSTPPPRRHLH
jgi:hypothetical protein